MGICQDWRGDVDPPQRVADRRVAANFPFGLMVGLSLAELVDGLISGPSSRFDFWFGRSRNEIDPILAASCVTAVAVLSVLVLIAASSVVSFRWPAPSR